MGKRSFAMGLVLAALTATVVMFANGGTVAAGPEARLPEAAKGKAGGKALSEPIDAGGLTKIARAVLNALKRQDEFALFDTLAPWQQEAEALKQQRILREFQKGKRDWKSFAGRLGRYRYDVENKLNLKSAESLKALNPAQYSALMAGVYRLQGNPKAAERLKGRWYAVSAETGSIRPQSRGILLLVGGGVVTLENVEGDQLLVRGVRVGGAWSALSYDLDVAAIRIRLRPGAQPHGATPSGGFGGPNSEATRALMRIKAKMRVYFDNHDQDISGFDMSEGGNDIDTRELKGEYYSHYEIRLTSNANARGTLVIAHPIDPLHRTVVLVIESLLEEGSTFFPDEAAAEEAVRGWK